MSDHFMWKHARAGNHVIDYHDTNRYHMNCLLLNGSQNPISMRKNYIVKDSIILLSIPIFVATYN